MGSISSDLAEIGLTEIAATPAHYMSFEKINWLLRNTVLVGVSSLEPGYTGYYTSEPVNLRLVVDRLKDVGDDSYSVIEIKKDRSWGVLATSPCMNGVLYVERSPQSLRPFSEHILTSHGEGYHDESGEIVYRTYENPNDGGYLHYLNEIRVSLGKKNGEPVLIALSLNDGRFITGGQRIYTTIYAEKGDTKTELKMIPFPEYRPKSGRKRHIA